MSTLQEKLLELGFLDVTGTTEWCGGHEMCISIAPPNNRLRRDSNNGVRVVVDNHGHYWIQPCQMNQDSAEQLATLFDQLVYGAHVPHSNDGGNFIRSVWPWLYNISPSQESGLTTVMVIGGRGKGLVAVEIRKPVSPTL